MLGRWREKNLSIVTIGVAVWGSDFFSPQLVLQPLNDCCFGDYFFCLGARSQQLLYLNVPGSNRKSRIRHFSSPLCRRKSKMGYLSDDLASAIFVPFSTKASQIFAVWVKYVIWERKVKTIHLLQSNLQKCFSFRSLTRILFDVDATRFHVHVSCWKANP